MLTRRLGFARARGGCAPAACAGLGATPEAKDRPDLVIEVVWTSGGLDKLEIYRRLGVGEVWFWKRDALSVHVLVDGRYQPRAHSVCLPELDLDLVCRLVSVDPLNEAIRQLRESLGSTR